LPSHREILTVSESPPIAQIRPARWFKHALSIGELVAMLDARLRAFECAKDVRAAFCRARLAQLRHAAGLLDAGAFVASAAWVERLEIEHVHAYLRAADSWDRRDLSLTAAPWRLVFAREHQGHTNAAESLRAGTNAHLAYDLPLALARIGTTTVDRTDTAAAYEKLTRVYAQTTAGAVHETMNRYGRAPRLRFGRRQDAISGVWQRELRAQAWDDAVALIDAADDAQQTAFTRIELAAVCEIKRAAGTPSTAAR
jgi:hypothetical protein